MENEATGTSGVEQWWNCVMERRQDVVHSSSSAAPLITNLTLLCPLQAYSEPTANYLHGQPVYPGHQQGVVVQQGGTVTTIVTSQTVQQVRTTILLI